MTCHAHQYSDRAQLMALGSHDAGDVVGLPHSGSAPASVNQDQPSIPAPITETQPRNGAQSDMIASRCRRMRFRSNEARKRFLSVHAILSRGI